MATPVPRPCSTRAPNSQPTPSATANTAIAAASSSSETSSTGRRPTRSDSAPVVSSAAISANAYTAKIAVRVTGEKPKRRSYSG